jgi:hypothetical protein
MFYGLQPSVVSIEVVSKPRITPEGKAQADSKAQHTRQYVSISRGLQHRHRVSDGVMKPLLMIFVGNVAYAVILGEDEEAPERQQYRTIGLRRVVRAQRLGICSEKTNPIVWPEHVKVGA